MTSTTRHAVQMTSTPVILLGIWARTDGTRDRVISFAGLHQDDAAWRVGVPDWTPVDQHGTPDAAVTYSVDVVGVGTFTGLSTSAAVDVLAGAGVHPVGRADLSGVWQQGRVTVTVETSTPAPIMAVDETPGRYSGEGSTFRAFCETGECQWSSADCWDTHDEAAADGQDHLDQEHPHQ